MSIIRGTYFRPVENASGLANFFGEGYRQTPHVSWLRRLLGNKIGFVSKTTTIGKRRGNMPLRDGTNQSIERFPGRINFYPWKGVALNAVGLSGNGLEWLLQQAKWQLRTDPFWISFMAIGSTVEERLAETREFVRLLKRKKLNFRSTFGVEQNFSCPNVGRKPTPPEKFINEVHQMADIVAELDVPYRVKFVVTTDVGTAKTALEHEAIDALVMSNTIPFGHQILPKEIWECLFGTADPEKSPLAQYKGGGGLSGWPLRKLVLDWISDLRYSHFHKPIWACGAMGSYSAVGKAYIKGASGIQIGTDAVMRPAGIPLAVWRAYRLFER